MRSLRPARCDLFEGVAPSVIWQKLWVRDTQVANPMGIEATVVPQSNVLDGINVVRRMLGRIWIDGDRCERGI